MEEQVSIIQITIIGYTILLGLVVISLTIFFIVQGKMISKKLDAISVDVNALIVIIKKLLKGEH